MEVLPESFTASLLHDIGKLTFSRFLYADYLQWLAAAREPRRPASMSSVT